LKKRALVIRNRDHGRAKAFVRLQDEFWMKSSIFRPNLGGGRVRFTTLEFVDMKLKQLSPAGHLASAQFYTRIQERFGTQAPPVEAYVLVVPERLTMEE
jgi:hypothetical protein